MTNSISKHRVCREKNVNVAPDFLSNLPDNIIEEILRCLPLREFARTSVLSSKWRYKWTRIPYLIFDRKRMEASSTSEALNARLELILAGLHCVEMLFISEHLMEILAICVAPNKLHTTYHHLRDLSFVINFSHSKLFPIVLCLFRSSPCLQNLTISVPSIGQFRVVVEDELGFDFPNEEDIIFPELKTITLSEFRGLNNELGFIKFICMNAVKLNTLDIIWYPNFPAGLRSHILARILKFQRASTTAVVNVDG